MLGRVLSVGVFGIDGYLVEVEFDVRQGLPAIVVVGLPDAAVKESKDRVATGICFEGTDGWVGNASFGRPVEASSPEILQSVIGPKEVHLFTCPAGEHRNFLDCVKSRQDPYFPAEIGHRCSTVSHLGNIAMWTGRKLRWDPVKEEFPGDADANRYLDRALRSPWVL